MTNREKVIKGLECCMIAPGLCSEECPYRGQGDETAYCDEKIIKDVYTLLKAQEPRVMRLEEVRDSLKQPIWKDTKSSNAHLYTGWVLAYDIQRGQGITGERLGMAEPSGRVVWYRLEDYGRTWRCWTSCPTDEQRRAESWNE